MDVRVFNYRLLLHSASMVRQPFKVLPTNAPRVLEIATSFKGRYSIIKRSRHLMLNEERTGISISKDTVYQFRPFARINDEPSNSIYSGVRSKDPGGMRRRPELEFASKYKLRVLLWAASSSQ